MSVMPFVSVVMPAHNEEQYIAECLTALKKQDYPTDRFEIIVVDNNSKDRTSEIASTYGVKVLFKEKGPVGAVRNYGVSEAKGDIIAFIDSDCVAPRNWISSGVALLQSNQHGAFGGRCTLRENPFWLEKYWLLEGDAPSKPPAEFLGCSIFLERETFLGCGMFDETITSGEDSKLSSTLRQKGSMVGFSTALNVAHLGNPTDTKSFFKRQIWHSENYLKDLKTSLHDKTFLLILLFYFSGVACLGSMLLGNLDLALIFLLAFLGIPALFSTKRMLTAQYKPKKIQDMLSIYYLDLLYLLARCTGLTKGLMNLIRSPKHCDNKE